MQFPFRLNQRLPRRACSRYIWPIKNIAVLEIKFGECAGYSDKGNRERNLNYHVEYL
jgi:hypothetical protein